MNKIDSADVLPAAIGPILQAVTNGRAVVVSGQLPIEPGAVIVGRIVLNKARTIT